MVFLSTLASLLIITLFVLGMWLHKLRKRYSKTQSTGNDHVYPNPYEEVDHGSEQHLPHQESGPRQSQRAPLPVTGSKPEYNNSDHIQKGNRHKASKPDILFKQLSTSLKRETQQERQERESLMITCAQEKEEEM